MKLTKKMMMSLTVLFCLSPLCIFANEQASAPENEICFDLDGISEVIISYDEENITFFEGSTEELVIKEYMTSNREQYYAKVEEKQGSIHVSEGTKPFFKNGFIRKVEVYLPASYNEHLSVITTNGNIILPHLRVRLSTFYTESTSGTIQIDSLSAENITLLTTSGNIVCSELNGNITYISTNGNLDIKSAIGSGSFIASNSGKINIHYTEVQGDLYLFNKNDDISLTLPADLAFAFSAVTRNGSVNTNFQQNLTINEGRISGNVGINPAVSVQLETRNGNIKVTQ